MGALEYARGNIESFVNELSEDATKAALKYRNKIPPDADVLEQFAADGTAILRRFADRCSQIFVWFEANKHPTDEWRNGEEWYSYCVTQMGFLENRIGDIIEPLSREVGVTVNRESRVSHARNTLSTNHAEVLRKLKLDIDQKVAESKSKSAIEETERGEARSDKWKDRTWGFVSGAGLALIAAALAWAFRAPATPAPPNSCQSSSPATVSSQGQTPQASVAYHPSAPPSAGPPPVSHPAPATPSSTRRP